MAPIIQTVNHSVSTITESHCNSSDSNDNDNDSLIRTMDALRPQSGDIVTLENLVFKPQNDFIPEPLFDLSSSSSSSTTTTTTTIVLDGGHYLPGLHEIIRTQCCLNTTISNISIDAGYGHYRSDLVFHVPISKFQQSLSQNEQQSPILWKVGTSIRLQPGDISVMIKDVLDHGNIVVLDANAPLAGSSYLCSFKLIAIHRIENPTFVPQPRLTKQVSTRTSVIRVNEAIMTRQYQIATFALGCFWGAELAYMRTNGVVGTRVGYTNGGNTTITTTTHHPTYQDVCNNNNDELIQPCEAVQVIYDTNIVSYSTLIDIAIDRIRTTTSTSGYDLHRLFQLENDDHESKQYRHGIYYHSKEQLDMIQSLRQDLDTTENNNNNNYTKTANTWLLLQRSPIEICPATTFYEAEEYHQQYLYKGGQSARKGATEPIRCYG